MSFPNRNNPYNFDPFLEWRKGFDYYNDDIFIQKAVKHFCGNAWEMVDEAARKISPKASFRWRDMAENIALPEKRPHIVHYDGYNHRIDRLVRPYKAEILEKEVFSEGLFSGNTSPWVKYIQMYLIFQNGEAGIACPLTCTDGLVALLEKFADTPELRQILEHCKEGIDGEYGIGAQYLSEIQGGSDVAANLLEAVKEEDSWRLYGKKFFCSAAHADYAVVTAKPAGSEKIAIFVVPSWLPGNKEKERRNGYTIDRIKWKMGTCELITAEITFNGATAYPAGPLDRGLANVVGIVLTCSRLLVGLSGAASMTRAVREAKQYAEFREAFGSAVARFPMLAGQIKSMEHFAQRTTAGALKLYKAFLGAGRAGKGRTAEDIKKERFDVRALIMLQKITASWDAVDVIRQAISIFGGHGAMEGFSSLPRLYRDAVVNELWEGPGNVLLSQIHRDFQKVSDWYAPTDFVSRILGGTNPAVAEELSKEMTELTTYPSLLSMTGQTMEVCRRWDTFCHRLFHAYQDQALSEIPL